MGRRSTTGGVTPAGNRIAVRITWKGEDIRPTLDLKPTAANLLHARRLRATILQEIKDGTFVLASHFPNYRFASHHEQGNAEENRTFKEWFDLWAKLSARSLENSTLTIYKRHMAAYWLPALGGMAPRRITNEVILRRLADLATERFDEATGKVSKALSRKTQNNVMIPLRAVLGLACKSLKIPDPTEGIDNLKTQKPPPDPFTAEETEIVLAKIRELEGDEAHDWFEFAFFAGLRVSEQIALPWADVDLRAKTIVVRGAVVLGKAKDSTKTHVERTVELNDRAAGVIERQRARTQMQRHGRVFATIGQPSKHWHDDQIQWRVWNRVLRLTGVRYRAPKECRDTSVTLALQAGADVVWVASQHGHSVQVMLKSYAKWIPNADRGRNRAAVNRSLAGPAEPDSAVEAQ